MIAHSIKDAVTLKEFVASGECPWGLSRLKQIAHLALTGNPQYSQLPFYRPRPRSRILVNPALMRVELMKSSSKGYRKSTV